MLQPTTMFAFTPTHEITLVFDDDTSVDIEVQLVHGAASTFQDWIAGRDATWTLAHDGTWRWCGRSRPPACKHVEVRSVTEAAFRRLAWELVGGPIRVEDDRLVLARDSVGARALWLEIRDDALVLVDRHEAIGVSVRMTAAELRVLACEWRACGLRWLHAPA